MDSLTVFIIVLILAAAVVAVRKQKLTPAAGITGAILALLILAGAGVTGVLLMAAFFKMGTMATNWGISVKESRGIVRRGEAQRQPMQVLANGGVAGICALIALIDPALRDLCLIMMAGSFSAAAADTVSSELGSLYGKRFYDIRNRRKAVAGPDGVVSLEGFLFGMAGSAIIALLYMLLTATGMREFGIVVLAGTIGNLVDSLLGAWLERSGRISNNMVNLLNTVSGAIVAAGIY